MSGSSDEPSNTEQSSIDPFREMNRYDDRHEDYPSDAVFEPPRRTMTNYWAKFHAVRDCGGEVYLAEKTSYRSTGEKWAYELRCRSCGYGVDEDEVLFIGGEWYSTVGCLEHGRSLGDLWLPASRILELGPDPDEDEVSRALNLTRIERQASILGLSFGNETYRECDDCGQETWLLFDRRCRMCYDGEWTGRMTDTLSSAVKEILVRNNSFAHRLEREVDPFSIHDRLFEDKILWRANNLERVPRMVEVKQCLQDDSDDHWEYVLTDLTHTNEWRYHEDDVRDLFYDTGLYSRDVTKPIEDDEIREAYQHVCDHAFREVHDSKTHEVSGEQCYNCRLFREVA